MATAPPNPPPQPPAQPPVQPPPAPPVPPPTPAPPVDPWADTERLLITHAPWLLVVTFVATVILLIMTIFHDIGGADKRMLALGMSVLFAAITIVFLSRFIRTLESGEPFGIESHWGGLGGGVGGWRISKAIIYLLSVVTFAALTAVAMSSYVPSEKKEQQEAATEKTTTATKSADKSKGKTTKQATTTTAGTTQGTTTTQAPASDTTATAATATKGQ